MTIAIERDEHGFLIPRAHGVRRDEYGESGYKWAVYDRLTAEVELGSEGYTTADEEAGSYLTGWCRFERGPGRPFGSDPWVILSRTRVLVKQFCGLDI
jgi:hypothetical protein